LTLGHDLKYLAKSKARGSFFGGYQWKNRLL
jgi:hypothetical protein